MSLSDHDAREAMGRACADWRARVAMYARREEELGIRLAALAAMFTREEKREERERIERRALAARAELAVVSSQRALLVRCLDELDDCLRKEGSS